MTYSKVSTTILIMTLAYVEMVGAEIMEDIQPLADTTDDDDPSIPRKRQFMNLAEVVPTLDTRRQPEKRRAEDISRTAPGQIVAARKSVVTEVSM